MNNDNSTKKNQEGSIDVLTLGGGCFWCTEAIFKRVRGIHSAIPGYSGGVVADPTYEQVCSGNTGHAEVVQVKFDPTIISTDKILEIFWYTHDPTTLNRQGHDVGTQYRSAVFYHSLEQKKVSERIKNELDKKGVYSDPIVTEITPFKNFYPAEKYHINYYDNNRNISYCSYVIDPKVNKLISTFKKEIKDGVTN